MYRHRLTRKEKVAIVYFLISLAIFSISLFSYKCISTEVCKPSFIETIIRHKSKIITSNTTLFAEVADTSFSREEGLSGRSGLSEKRGMLFAFDLPGRYGFWMKDMSFPIDIVWINENGVVVDIVENAKPEDYPEVYVNKIPASYVLEIGANKSHDYGIYLGSKLLIKK